MSIRIMTQVWDTSPYQGAKLLIELAFADYANDDGICWPSHASVARKARATEEYVRRVVREMEEQKRLVIEVGGGRGKTNRYRLYPAGDGPERETLQLGSGPKPPTVNPQHSSPNAEGEKGNSDGENPHPSCPDPSGDPSKESPKALSKASAVSGEQVAALKAKYPHINVDRQLEKFDDYRAARGRVYRNLDAAFRLWVGREADGRPSQHADQRPAQSRFPDRGRVPVRRDRAAEAARRVGGGR